MKIPWQVVILAPGFTASGSDAAPAGNVALRSALRGPEVFSGLGMKT